MVDNDTIDAIEGVRIGRPPHEPTAASRHLVEQHAAVGTPQAHIAELIGISANTLVRHYRAELDLGLAKANAAVASVIFSAAKRGNIRAAMFWMLTRGGWVETKRHHVSGNPEAPPVTVRHDLSGLTQEQRDQLRDIATSMLKAETLEDLMQARDAARAKVLAQ